MPVTIKATYELPSKRKLWLVRVTGVNEKRFSGKNGLLQKYTNSRCMTFDDTYYRVKHVVPERRYMIASVDEWKEKDANFTFEKIWEFSMSADDICYQFTFGFGDAIYAPTIEELKKKIAERSQHCAEHIVKASAAQRNIERLAQEMGELPTGD